MNVSGLEEVIIKGLVVLIGAIFGELIGEQLGAIAVGGVCGVIIALLILLV